LLRNMGPDVLMATHSTEIVSETETDDIVLVDKRNRNGRRIQRPSELQQVFGALGSNLNPILTQLAKTRRVLFVEGKDYQILAGFARRLGLAAIANRSEFAVVPIEGFNTDRIRALRRGMERTLGVKIAVGAVLDRDFRSDGECAFILRACASFCDFVSIYGRKEIENFLLVPSAIDRACTRRVLEQAARTQVEIEYSPIASQVLEEFALSRKSYVAAQYLASRRQFEKTNSPGVDETILSEAGLTEFEKQWSETFSQFELVPGKEALSAMNKRLQQDYDISITPLSILHAMHIDEIPTEMQRLLEELSRFAKTSAEQVPADRS